MKDIIGFVLLAGILLFITQNHPAILFAIAVLGIAYLAWRLRPDPATKRVLAVTAPLVDKHIDILARKRLIGTNTDDYGNLEASIWKREMRYFTDSVIVPAVKAKYAIEITPPLRESIEAMIDKAAKEQQTAAAVSHNFSADMHPVAYERFCAEELKGAGWRTSSTPVTGDQGADILAYHGHHVVVIQCKLYSQPVGNSAVQEVSAAKAYYDATAAAVVSNASYTPAAKQLAAANKVLLLHHSELQNLLSRL